MLYQTSFDDLAGWNNGNCWSVDSSPSLNGTIHHSPPTSLNCNQNDLGDYSSCFNTYASSPVLDLGQLTSSAQLSFWCKWITENACDVATKQLLVVSQATGAYHVDMCMTTPATCPTNDWHQHNVQLDPSWGPVTIYFYFDAYGAGHSFLGGWMVDDLVVSDTCGISVPYCTPKLNSQGCTPIILTSGVPSFSGTGAEFRVQAQKVLNQHPGLVIWSLSQAATPFGGGTLCLGSPVNRTGGQGSGGNVGTTDCSGSYSFPFTPAEFQANGLTPGTQVNVQYWSRDTGFAAPQNVGLTAAMSFTVCN